MISLLNDWTTPDMLNYVELSWTCDLLNHDGRTCDILNYDGRTCDMWNHVAHVESWWKNIMIC